MPSIGFSTFVAPCATSTCWSPAESTLAGAYPVDFVFALGTFVSEGLELLDAATAAVATAATPTTPSIQRMRRFIFSPFSEVDVTASILQRSGVHMGYGA